MPFAKRDRLYWDDRVPLYRKTLRATEGLKSLVFVLQNEIARQGE